MIETISQSSPDFAGGLGTSTGAKGTALAYFVYLCSRDAGWHGTIRGLEAVKALLVSAGRFKARTSARRVMSGQREPSDSRP